LRTRGYEVTFREFDGGHEVPATVADDAMRWVATTPTA
jgi:predicted esterase